MILVHLINYLSLQVVNQTNLNVQLKNHLNPKVFGCATFVHLFHTQKFDMRVLRCMFVGYFSSYKGYKCYHPISKKFYVSRDITSHEQELYCINHVKDLVLLGREHVT